MTRRSPILTALAIVPDRELASQFASAMTNSRSFQIVGLHVRNDSDAILRSLRMGACEFLYAPFDPEIQNEAVARLHRLLEPNATEDAQPGTIVAFSSAKPGSGASTLAAQTAFALRRNTSKRVLLVDFDLMGGMIGFYLKLSNTKSLLDALHSAENLNDGVWHSLISVGDGLDVLP